MKKGLVKKYDERIIFLIIIIIALLSITILRLSSQTLTGEAGKGGKDVELSPIVTECNDGIDNDGDGLLDWQLDLGCWSSEDDKEIAEPRADEDGWTTFDPSSDTIITYVSSSLGKDEWTGRCPIAPTDESLCGPKKTLAAGHSQLREGYPDWLLMRFGDKWYWESFGNPANQGTSGRSDKERLILGGYSTGETLEERPALVCGSYATRRSNNVVIRDLDFAVYSEENHCGGSIISGGGGKQFSNLIVEGNNFPSGGALNVQGYTNLEFRRNSVYDGWVTDGNGKITANLGAYTEQIDELLNEGNVYYSNGLKMGPSGERTANDPKVATWFLHNFYNQANNWNVIVRENILSDGAGEGLMDRAAGEVGKNLVENNFLAGNPMGITLGYTAPNFDWPSINSKVDRNVILEAVDLEGDGGWNIRGSGITASHLAANGQKPGFGRLEITNNIIALKWKAGLGQAIGVSGSVEELIIEGNKIYNFEGSGTGIEDNIGINLGMQLTGEPGTSYVRNNIIEQSKGVSVNGWPSEKLSFSSNTYYNTGLEGRYGFPTQHFNYGSISDAAWISNIEPDAKFAKTQFKDPEKATIAAYMESLGFPPEKQNRKSFTLEAIKNRRGKWDERFTADAINNFIRDKVSIVGEAIPKQLEENSYPIAEPIVYYNFDGDLKNSGENKGKDGIPQNEPKFGTGKIGQALELDGINDYVRIKGPLSIPGSVTITGWIYSENFERGGEIIVKNPINYEWTFMMNGDALAWRGSALGLGTARCTTKPVNGQWTHVAIRQIGNNAELYLDGERCTDIPGNNVGAVGNGPGDITIGAFGSDERNYDGQFYGKIDELKIFNRALTEQEIINDMNGVENGASVCGNGIKEGGEICDKSTQACFVGEESGIQSCKGDCSGYNSCQITTICGNGKVETGEECDDGNNNNNADSCTNQCLTNTPQTPKCNDKIMNGDETGIDCGGLVCDACTIPKTDSEKYKENFDGGKTTDLEKEEDLSKVPLTLERNGMGVIEFTNIIDFKKYDQTKTVNQIFQKINDYIKIFNEKSGNILGTVSVDTGEQALKELSNEPATVTINIGGGKNINLLKVQRDGIDCEKPLCTVESYDSTTGELVFLVEHFTNYTVVENNETNNSYTPPASGGNGGGSGGGGGSIVKKNATSNNKTIAQAPPIISLTGQNNNAIEKLKELGEEVSKNYEEKPKNAGIIIDTITIILIITIVILTIMTAKTIRKIKEGSKNY